MPKLTKRIVDQIAAEPDEVVHWDDELKGFGLRVWPSGRKVYIVKCRIKGRQRRITIGPHGPITPEQARIRAFEILSAAKGGGNPAKAHDDLRRSPTVREVGERFLDEHVAVRCKPITQREYRRAIELFIVPALGTWKILDVDRKDIAELHHKWRHTPYQANRTLSVASKMFNMTELWGLRPDGSNPCRHVKKYPERRRERFLSADEFGQLGRVLRTVEEEGTESPAAIAAIRLLMLTGCRMSEILTLKWSYVDLKTRELRLPDSKTGAKVVHFGKAAAGVLAAIPRITENPYVVVGRKLGARLTDLEHPWRRIRARAKLDDVRLHDLRHSYASGALALGEGLPMIGRLLGHTQVQTTARYAHLAKDPVKMAASRVSEMIARAMSNGPKAKRRDKAESQATKPLPPADERPSAAE